MIRTSYRYQPWRSIVTINTQAWGSWQAIDLSAALVHLLSSTFRVAVSPGVSIRHVAGFSPTYDPAVDLLAGIQLDERWRFGVAIDNVGSQQTRLCVTTGANEDDFTWSAGVVAEGTMPVSYMIRARQCIEMYSFAGYLQTYPFSIGIQGNIPTTSIPIVTHIQYTKHLGISLELGVEFVM